MARPMPAAPAVTKTLLPSTRSEGTVIVSPTLSDPEHRFAECEIGEERLRGARVACVPAVEHVGAVGQRQYEVQVVLDDEDRDLAAQLVERLEHFLHHRGGEALEG